MKNKKSRLALAVAFALTLECLTPAANTFAAETDAAKADVETEAAETEADSPADSEEAETEPDSTADSEEAETEPDSPADTESAEPSDTAEPADETEEQATEAESDSGDIQAGVRIVGGEFCWFSEDGSLDEEKTGALKDAAQDESDITELLALIGEPEDEEYFGQGCWYGASGEEDGEDGAWYYENFTVYVYKTDNITYYMGADAVEEQSEQSLQERIEAIVGEETEDSEPAEDKLETLFRCVEEQYSYARKTGFEAYDEWPADFALEMLQEEAGSCYHYAALYAFLAKAATDFEVRICIGTADGFETSSWQTHAWTEIQIDGVWYVFDTNMDKYGADSSLTYYYLNTESNQYDKLYRPESYFDVSWDTGTASETEDDTEAESDTESGTEAAAETAPDSEAEAESGSDTETEAGADAEASAEMTDTIYVSSGGETVLELPNYSGLSYTNAELSGTTMVLTDADGTEHTFLEADVSDMSGPYLVMYGSFLAVKYTSVSKGKAARIAEEGDELVFEEAVSMQVTGSVYVRTEPDINSSAISVVEKGNTISVIGETGKWYKIRLADGREGYVSKVLVIVEDETVSTASGTAAETVQETETETEPDPEYVIVERNGRYHRYELYAPTEDSLVKVDGKLCYVEAGGTCSEGWKILDGKLYYSEEDGQVKCSCTWDGITLGEDGAAQEGTNTSLKLVTTQILNSITTADMSRSDKLYACWKYVTGGHITYAGKYPDLSVSGWQRSMALNVLTSGSGNCYGFACAFAALAEAVGYDPVVVCGRVTGSRDGAADGMTRHSWVMIDGCHYDPEAQYAGWCTGIYGYGSYPVNHSVQQTVEF